jgi:hypothetical protein
MGVERPRVLGGLTLLAGYLQAAAKSAPRVADPEAVAALRSEQRARMRRVLSGARGDADAAAGGGPSFWSPR